MTPVLVAVVGVVAATVGFVVGRRFHHIAVHLEVDRNGHDQDPST